MQWNLFDCKRHPRLTHSYLLTHSLTHFTHLLTYLLTYSPYTYSSNSQNGMTEQIAWEKRWLLFNDSIIGMSIVLLVVLVAVTLSVVRLWITNFEAKALVFDYVITVYFITGSTLAPTCSLTYLLTHSLTH